MLVKLNRDYYDSSTGTFYGASTVYEVTSGVAASLVAANVATYFSSRTTDSVAGVGMVAAQKHFSCAAYPAGTTGVTIQNQIPLPYAFTGFKLVYLNGTSTASTLNTSKVASPTADSDTGSSLTWTSVTFSGATSVALPVISGSEPHATRTLVVSDHVSLPAASTSLPLILARSYFSGSACAENPAAGEFTSFRTSTGLKYRSGFSAGVVADNAGITTTEGQLLVPAGVLPTYATRAVTVGCVGGSTLRGQGSTANATGVVYKACSLVSSSSLIVSPFIGAFSGQNSVASLANAQQVISAIRPDILVILPGSGNDSDLTAAGFEAMKGRTASAIDLCRRNGVIPIIATLMPSSSLSAPQEALRVAQNAWLMALPNVIKADIAAVVENPANRATLLASVDSGDGTHTNDTGVNLTGPVLAVAVNVAISHLPR